MNLLHLVAAHCSEVFLWGMSGDDVVEASFDGYSRQPVVWTGEVGSEVEWIVAGPGGVPVMGWGVEFGGVWIRATLGEAYTPAGGDVIVVVPRLAIDVVGAG